MFILYWPLVIFFTIIMYLLMLVSLPFNPTHATVYLFAIVAFWSRLPGVGMPTPMYILYLADFVDFFSLIVAVNLGPIPGVIFTIFTNMASRACGIFPTWRGVAKDAFAQSVACIFIPFIHPLTGSDIFVSMIIYSIIRLIAYCCLFWVPGSWTIPEMFANLAVIVPLQIAINALYAKWFGNFFDALLSAGVQFNWLIFAIVTAVIVISRYTLFGKSKSKGDPIVTKYMRKLFGKKKRRVRMDQAQFQNKSNNQNDPRRFI